MTWQEQLKKYLQDIGLNEEGEFSVYYELLVNNFGKQMKASDIAERVGMNRSYVYNILSNLVEKELVTVVLDSSPKSYVAQNPINFVDKQLVNYESKIEVLKKFRNFIKTEIEPELDKIKHLTTSPVKETFLLNSTVKLADYVNQSLRECAERIIMRISFDFIDSIRIELANGIERLLITGKKDSIRIICSLKGNEEINFPYPDLIAVNNKESDEYQIIIDDSFYLFNFHLSPFTQPYGVGLMVKEPKVAESYTFSLLSSFKELTYNVLPVPTEKDLSKVIRDDKAFIKSLESLFSMGWKIFPAGSSSEGNYFALIAPDHTPIQEARDAGFQYEPFNDVNQNDLITKIFNEARIFSGQGALEGKSRFDIDYNESIKEETIEGFSCKILEYQSNIDTVNPWTAEIFNKNLKSKKKAGKGESTLYKSRMVVFNYCNRAAIMVWALLDDNLVTILKEIRKFIN